MSSKNEWDPCPQGTIVDMVARRRSERATRQRVQWATAIVSVVAIAALTVSFAWNQPTNSKTTKLSCRRVAELVEAYHEGALAEELVARVQFHLTTCSHCREYYEHYSGTEVTAAQRKPHETFFAFQPR